MSDFGHQEASLLDAFTRVLGHAEGDRLPRFLDLLSRNLGLPGCLLVERGCGGAKPVTTRRTYTTLHVSDGDLAAVADAAWSGRPRPLENVVVIRRVARDQVNGDLARAALILGPPGEARGSAPVDIETVGWLVGDLLAAADRSREASAYARLANAANARLLTRDWAYRIAREFRAITGFEGSVSLYAWDGPGMTLVGIAHLPQPAGAWELHAADGIVGGRFTVGFPLADAFADADAILVEGPQSGRRRALAADVTAGSLAVRALPATAAQSDAAANVAATVALPDVHVLLTPLRAQGDVVGVAAMAASSRFGLGERHLHVASRCAAFSTLALERDRQFETELEHLENAAGGGARSTTGEQLPPSGAVLTLLTQRIRRHRAADVVAILPYDASLGAFVVESAVVDPPDARAHLRPDSAGSRLAHLLQTGDLESHRAGDESATFPFARAAGIRSSLAVTLPNDAAGRSDTPLGMLAVGYLRGRATGATTEPIAPRISARDKEWIHLYARVAGKYMRADQERNRRQAVDVEVRALYQKLSEREVGIDGTGEPETSDSHPLLRQILDVALKLVNATAGVIAVPCHDHPDLKVLVATNLISEHSEHVAYGDGVTGAAAALRSTIIISDAGDPDTWPEGVHRLPWVSDSQSEVAIPLLAGGEDGRLLGVLDVESQLVTDAFGPEEVGVLEQLARAASLALDLHRVIAHLRALRDVAESVDEATTRDGMLRSVLEQAMNVTEAYAGSIRLVDPTSRYLEPALHLGVPGEFAGEALEADADGVVPWVFANQRECYLEDFENLEGLDDRYPGLRPLVSRNATRSELAIPLTWLGDRMGVLNLEHVQADGLGVARDFAKGLANQAASALYRDRRQSRRIRSRDQSLVSGVVQLASTIAHDIRLHFTSIGKSCELALQSRDVSEELRAFIAQIDAQSKQGAAEALDLLTHAADPLAVDEPVSVIEVVSEVVAEVVADAGASSVQPRLEVTVGDDARDAIVWCRRAFLSWSLKKVVENSCDYAGAEPAIQVAVARDGRDLRITIEDDGPGMSSEQSAQLFEWERPTIEPHGSGFALPLVGSFINAIGGTVAAKSKGNGEGLITSFYLPVEPA